MHVYVGNFTTNLAEGWMHIRSKFDGGKQIGVREVHGKADVLVPLYTKILDQIGGQNHGKE